MGEDEISGLNQVQRYSILEDMSVSEQILLLLVSPSMVHTRTSVLSSSPMEDSLAMLLDGLLETVPPTVAMKSLYSILLVLMLVSLLPLIQKQGRHIASPLK